MSTGGTPSAAAKKALAALIQKNQPLEVVLAFDNDMAGHGYARQMKEHLAEQSQMPGMSNFSIRTEFPDGVKDWNETLKPKTIEPCPLAPKESESEHIHSPGHGQGISPSQDHSDQPANTLALEIKTERPNRTFRNIEKNQGFER